MRERAPDPVFEEFVRDAREASFEAAVALNGFHPAKGLEKGKDKAGPCPACAGRDRFSVHFSKRKFNCRVCGVKGIDALSLALVGSHIGFIEACEVLAGRKRPDGVRAETPEEKAAREARRADDARKAAEKQARDEKTAEEFRARERASCLRLWEGGAPPTTGRLGRYFEARGLRVPAGAMLREIEDFPFYHGQEEDERGQLRQKVLHRGPAMLAAMVQPDQGMVGLHMTWLAPDWGGKAVIKDPETGEKLNPKKMRGTKKGSYIPLRMPDAAGLFTTRRLFIAEGIETAVSVAVALHAANRMLPADAFWAAGDLGNLGGPALGAAKHPILKTAKGRPLGVSGPEPDLSAPGIMIPSDITHLVLLGDGDSDPFTTRMALQRGAARYAREGLTIAIAMAPEGGDFNDLLRGGA